jgi:hypothetical protein
MKPVPIAKSLTWTTNAHDGEKLCAQEGRHHRCFDDAAHKALFVVVAEDKASDRQLF